MERSTQRLSYGSCNSGGNRSMAETNGARGYGNCQDDAEQRCDVGAATWTIVDVECSPAMVKNLVESKETPRA